MRILGIIGAVLGVIAIFFAMYYIAVVIPTAESADAAMERILSSRDYNAMDSPFDNPAYKMNFELRSMKVDYGEYLMATGLLAFLLSIFPAIKKQKIAWIGVGLGLISLFIGAAYGTHMLS